MSVGIHPETHDVYVILNPKRQEDVNVEASVNKNNVIFRFQNKDTKRGDGFVYLNIRDKRTAKAIAKELNKWLKGDKK